MNHSKWSKWSNVYAKWLDKDKDQPKRVPKVFFSSVSESGLKAVVDSNEASGLVLTQNQGL
jgi:hypothetical protein